MHGVGTEWSSLIRALGISIAVMDLSDPDTSRTHSGSNSLECSMRKLLSSRDQRVEESLINILLQIACCRLSYSRAHVWQRLNE